VVSEERDAESSIAYHALGRLRESRRGEELGQRVLRVLVSQRRLLYEGRVDVRLEQLYGGVVSRTVTVLKWSLICCSRDLRAPVCWSKGLLRCFWGSAGLRRYAIASSVLCWCGNQRVPHAPGRQVEVLAGDARDPVAIQLQQLRLGQPTEVRAADRAAVAGLLQELTLLPGE
jgi:hypothetical protein